MKLKRVGAGLSLLFMLLSIGGILAQALYMPGRTNAAVPPDNNSGWSLAATMIDMSHINVVASGTYSPDGDPTHVVDMSTVSGIYYDGRALAGNFPPDFHYKQGGDHGVGLSDPKCASILNIDEGGVNGFGSIPDMTKSGDLKLNVSYQLNIDPTGSTTSPDGCVPLNIDSAPLLLNQAIPFTPAAGNVGDPGWTANNQGASHGGYNGGSIYGSTVGLNNSEKQISNQTLHDADITFFKADDSTILSTQGDPEYDGAGVRAEFDRAVTSTGTGTATGSGDYFQKGGGTCPNYIVENDSGDPKSSDDTVQRVTYVVQKDEGGNCQTDRQWYVLMLTASPANVVAGLTNAQGGADAAGANQDQGCPINIWGLRWFACPIITGITDTLGKVTDTVQKWLVTDVPNTFDYAHSTQARAYHDAWSSFRSLAIGFIIIAGLVMVISEALGFEAITPYTIRRVLPRLIIFAILIELSWVGMQFIAQFSNNLSVWLSDIIVYPFHALVPHRESISGMIAEWMLTVGAGLVLGIAGLITFVGTIALAILALFVVLLVRYAALIGTIIFLPVALAAMILPGTRRFGRIILDEYIAVQVIFPLIFAIGFALAQVTRAVIANL